MVSRLIAFFGPDGSGKSTQVKLLAHRLEDCDERVRVVWIRSSHTLAFLLSQFFLRVGFYRVVSNEYGRETKIPAVQVNSDLRVFWSMLELLSVVPIILFRVYLPLSLGYTVIAERYVLDTIVSIAYSTDNMKFLTSRMARFLLHFIPRDTIFIHLDSSYAVIEKRRGSLTDPCHFLEFQKVGYKMLGELVGASPIDTSYMSVADTSNRIVEHVAKLRRWRASFGSRPSADELDMNLA
jgi:thymidylate kinase